MKKYAYEIFDIDKGFIPDRTKTVHRYPFDIDVRSPSAPPNKHHWIYWGSAKTIEKCRTMIGENAKTVKDRLGDPKAQARIVDAKTAEILEIIK